MLPRAASPCAAIGKHVCAALRSATPVGRRMANESTDGLGLADEFNRVVYVEQLIQLKAVGFKRSDRYPELRGSHLVPEAFCKQPEHLRRAPRELVDVFDLPFHHR